MVCSSKPTSSTASSGPTLPMLFSLRPAALTSTATPPSTPPSTTPSPPSTFLSLSLPPTLFSLSLSLSLLGERQQYDQISQKHTPHRVSRKSYRFVFGQGVKVSRKSNRFAWVRHSGGLEMVRPSENWERLVRATLRREKLRHDGRGGHERAPIGIAGSMPPSLTRETNIDLILPAANEIQSEDPNVARIRMHMYCLGRLVGSNGSDPYVAGPCVPRNPTTLPSEEARFSAFVSCRPSPLDTTQLWTSCVHWNAFESILSPLSLSLIHFHGILYSTFRFLLEQWRDQFPPGYLPKEVSIDKPFEEDACCCHFNFVTEKTGSSNWDLVLKYQWFVGERTPSNFIAIPEAAGEVYLPKHEDIGRILKVEIVHTSPCWDRVSYNICYFITSFTCWLKRRWNSSPVVIAGADDEQYQLTLDDVDSCLVVMYTPVTEEGVKGEP
ncbi:hypothetical protein RHGRI_017462 [Rhododendron griersonianum]|uniref:AIR9-like A9 domain-containing protein n=1 Tax=Rhododendron griersonianum TaxID=479676 RepID=A0AAV6JXX9_9ERIC|nr:hypothetical protein RHGRI_017462 [Rhododendron griersonianum]